MKATLIRAQSDGDEEAISRTVEQAFGRPEEATLVGALQAGGHVILSLVAEERGGGLVGHILFSRIRIETDTGPASFNASALAPVAVAPDRQRRGLGKALIREGLDRLKARGEDICFVVGDPAYYGQFGFDAALAAQYDCAYAGPYLMALGFTARAVPPHRSRAIYPEEFGQFA
jgi:putative acetyltransferase